MGLPGGPSIPVTLGREEGGGAGDLRLSSRGQEFSQAHTGPAPSGVSQAQNAEPKGLRWAPRMQPQLGPRAELPANIPNGKEAGRKEAGVQLEAREEGKHQRKGTCSRSIQSRARCRRARGPEIGLCGSMSGALMGRQERALSGSSKDALDQGQQ